MDDPLQHLDVLAFGAHPDDVEIGAGGVLYQWSLMGKRVGICDLTRGDLSSNGTVEQRQEEAKKAGQVLGISYRINLGFPDRGLTGDKEQLDAIARVIRVFQPKVLLIPHHQDRHPDHEQCHHLVKEAVFNAKIRRYQVHGKDGNPLAAHQVKYLFSYYINSLSEPVFFIDISQTMEVKMAALGAYQSQFSKKEGSVSTPLTEGYLERIRAREFTYGQHIGVQYAEGFESVTPLEIDSTFPWNSQERNEP